MLSTIIKELENRLHNVVHNTAHILLVLPIAGMKGLDAFLQHLITEASKI